MRPVDRAMREARAEKEAVRGLWLETVTGFAEAYPEDKHPLYLTLSGAEGRDIQLLIDHGLLATTPSGAISLDHRHRVIAVERNTTAVIELQRRFPGLKILEHPFQSLVRSDSPTRWPDGQDAKYCCARVINLDLNEPLTTTIKQGQLRFPMLDWVTKLGQIHAAERIDWSLCFTLHAELDWHADTWTAVQDFLCENFDREQQFERACETWFGDKLFAGVRGQLKHQELARADHQRLLMVFVPKKLAQLVYLQGWKVSTARNLKYGDTQGRAAMVSWIIDFTWDPRVSRRPDAVYRESLREILTGVGSIEEDGSIR